MVKVEWDGLYNWEARASISRFEPDWKADHAGQMLEVVFPGPPISPGSTLTVRLTEPQWKHLRKELARWEKRVEIAAEAGSEP